MAQASTSPGKSSGLLASCKGTVYLLKNQKWEGLYGNAVCKFHLIRQSPGNFVLFIVDDLPNLVVRPVGSLMRVCDCLDNPLSRSTLSLRQVKMSEGTSSSTSLRLPVRGALRHF